MGQTEPTSSDGATRETAASAATIALVATWTTVALVSIQTAVGAVNARYLDEPLLDPDHEGSVFQWLSVAATLGAGCAVAVCASAASRRRRLLLLAGVLVGFAVDDAVGLHERAGQFVGGNLLGLPDYLAVRIWLVILLPVLAAAFLLLVDEARRSAGDVRRLLSFGLGSLVAGVGVEALGAVSRNPALIDRIGGKPETMRILVEEGFELAGWLLIAGGFTARAVRTR